MSLASERYRMFSDFSKGIGSDLASVGEQKEREAGLALRTRRAKLEEPVLQARSMEAQKEIDFANAPFDSRVLIPQGETDMTMNYLTSDGIGKVAGTLGLSVKDNKFVTKDDKAVTNKDMGKYLPLVRAINGTMIDPGHALDSKVNALSKLVESGKATEEDKSALVELHAKQKDPNFLDTAREKQNMRFITQRDAFKRLGLPTSAFDESIKRNERKTAERKAVKIAEQKRLYDESQSALKHKRAKELKAIEQETSSGKATIKDNTRYFQKEFGSIDEDGKIRPFPMTNEQTKELLNHPSYKKGVATVIRDYKNGKIDGERLRAVFKQEKVPTFLYKLIEE